MQSHKIIVPAPTWYSANNNLILTYPENPTANYFKEEVEEASNLIEWKAEINNEKKSIYKFFLKQNSDE